jgi:hypothetical protein
VIVVNYVLRVALFSRSVPRLEDCEYSLNCYSYQEPCKIDKRSRFRGRRHNSASISLDDAINFQKQLDSVDIMARKVGLKIKRAKTEFMMVGNWASPIELRVSTGTINLVKNFKYLGS